MYKSTQFYMSFVGVQPLVFYSVFYIIVVILFFSSVTIALCVVIRFPSSDYPTHMISSNFSLLYTSVM